MTGADFLDKERETDYLYDECMDDPEVITETDVVDAEEQKMMAEWWDTWNALVHEEPRDEERCCSRPENKWRPETWCNCQR